MGHRFLRNQGFCSLDVQMPVVLDCLLSGIFISAGTEGFNSLLKFANYKKAEARKMRRKMMGRKKMLNRQGADLGVKPRNSWAIVLWCAGGVSEAAISILSSVILILWAPLAIFARAPSKETPPAKIRRSRLYLRRTHRPRRRLQPISQQMRERPLPESRVPEGHPNRRQYSGRSWRQHRRRRK